MERTHQPPNLVPGSSCLIPKQGVGDILGEQFTASDKAGLQRFIGTVVQGEWQWQGAPVEAIAMYFKTIFEYLSDNHRTNDVRCQSSGRRINATKKSDIKTQVCIRIYICMHTYIYIYLSISISINIYIHTYIYTTSLLYLNL